MNVLQVHLKLSDRVPNKVDIFEGDDVEFEVNVENNDSPIHFVAEREYYYTTNEDLCNKMGLDALQFVQTFHKENVTNGATKIDKKYTASHTESARSGNRFLLDKIVHKNCDLEHYGKIFLILDDIVSTNESSFQYNTQIIPLADLNFASKGKIDSSYNFQYCESYIALYRQFTVTLWCGRKKVIDIPKDCDSYPFIKVPKEAHYRLYLKKVRGDYSQLR